MAAHREPLRKVNVLAVDDAPANLVALEAVLGAEYNLICARSGAEAIAILQKNHDIGVILMDLQMPSMDGFEAAARIKKMESCRDIPIIMVSAVFREEPYIRKGYEAGAVDYFGKPFDPDILKRKVAIYSTFHQNAAVLRERERQIRELKGLLKVGRKLSSILEHLPVGVLTFDTEGKVVQTSNAEILDWWQSSAQAISAENGLLARALRDGESSNNELLQIHCVDGSAKTILGSTSPLFGLDGNIVGAVFVIQDMTEPKKIEENFEHRIARLLSLGAELEQHERQAVPGAATSSSY